MISHIIWKKINTHKSFKYTSIEHGVSQPLWNEGKGEKPSVTMRMIQDIRQATWHCDNPHRQTEDATEPPGALPYETFHWVFSSHRHPTWCSHVHKRRKKISLHQVKTPCVRFFCSTEIPFSIVFPDFNGEGSIPANQDMRHWKCKGVSHCWPKLCQSGPVARREFLLHQMSPIRGNLKLSPGGIQLHP